MLDRQPFSEFLPYLAYDEEKALYLLDNGVGFTFECSPIPFAGESTAATLRGLFEAVFPPDTSVQFILFASRNIGPMLDAYVVSRENVHGQSIYTEFAKARREFLIKGTEKSLFKGFNLKVRDFRLMISMSFPCERTPEAYGKRLDEVFQYKQTVLQILNTAHLNPRNMEPDKLISTMSEILNPSHPFDNTLHYNPKIPIKDQIVYTDTVIAVEKDHMVIDGKYCKSFTMKQYPEKWDISNGANFCGDLFQNVRQISSPFMLVMNCQYSDVGKSQAAIRNKAMMASYQAIGPLSNYFPELALKKQAFDSFSMTFAEGETPFFAYLNLFLFTDSQDEMGEVSGVCNSLYRSLGFIMQEDNYIMVPLFMQSFPMSYMPATQKSLRRRKTFVTSNVAELANVQAEWKGFGEPILQLIGRRGQLQFFDIFSNPTGGYSGVVVASTGSGKSFFVNDLTVSYLGVGAKIWTIDSGRSYEKLCKALGGEFIVFDKDSKICINPFSKIMDIDDEMPLLKDIVAQMSSKVKLDDLSLSFIEEAIKDVHGKLGNSMTVTNVSEYLAQKDDSRQKDLSSRLFPYTKNGAYAGYFEGESTLDPQNNYTVLELEELRNKKDLQEVVLLTLLFQIQQKIINDKAQRKLVIIDEAWDLLSGGNTTGFIEAGYRRFRKYKGACLSITQGINDFYKVPAGEAIIANSDFFFLLRQRPESIEALKKSQRISLSDGLYDLLKSVHTDTGNYSEIFIYTSTGITIGRLLVNRFTQLLYTTKAEEFAEVQKYMNEGMAVQDAIKKVIYNENQLSKGLSK